MSYISILLPAFYLKNWNDKEEIKNFCAEQFETTPDSFDIIEFNELEKDGKTGLGKIKHWHIYNIIAKKK